VHRLLELYTLTIHTFGHSRHVQELLFETAHQPLKRAFFRSNQLDPHIHAVNATIANDWECRLSIEVNRSGDPDSWTIEDSRGIYGSRELASSGLTYSSTGGSAVFIDFGQS
jgi:hypothetical protein